jgi:LysM repeat protein
MAAAIYTTSGASSHLYLTAAGAGNITLDAQTNNATVTLGGGIDFLGSGGGTERITPGTNTWTVGGSIDFTNGVFLAPTNHTLVLNGGSSSITFANQAPYNLTIASSAGITAQDSIAVGHTLNVASSGTLTLGSGAVMTLGSPVTLQGTITGSGTLYLDSVATIGSTGTLASNVTFDAVGGDITIPTRTFSGVGRTVRLIADTAPYTLGDSAGTLTIAGNLIIDDGGAEVVVDARPYNIAVSIGGSFTLAPSATPDIYFGTGTWTIGGNVDISNAFIASAATSTIDMTGSGVTMAWTSETIGTVMIHGSVTSTTGLTVATLLSVETGADFTFPNATTTIQGNFSNTGTIHGGSGTVAFTAGSTGKTIVCGSGSFNTVVFNNAAGGWTMQNSNCSVDGNFSLSAASAFTLQSGRTLTIAGTFTNSVGGSATTWSGSTLSLQGSGTNTIQSKAVTDAYGAIVIGSQRSVRTWNTTSTSVTVTSGGGFTSYDDQGSDGRLYINGTVHVPNGEAWSYDTDFDGASLGTARAVTVVVEPSSSIVVDAGDTLTIAGEEFSQHRTSVDRNGASGTFSMTIQGHLDAQYFDLHHLSSAGLMVGATGVVDRLSYGIFDDGVSGGSYITLSNPTSTLTTTSLVFDSIGNGVDAATPNSITASGSGVNWTMNGTAGQRTGSATDVVSSGASITWNIPTLSVLDGDAADIDVGAYTDHLAAHWTPSDTTYISTFTMQLGTSAGAADAYSATDVGPVLSTEITGLSLTNGQTYYVTIRGLNVLNDVVVSATSDGVLLDGAAPELTDLSVTADTTTASVAWTTDEAATSVVFFGTTSDLGTTVVNSSSLITSHTASLSNLTAGTQYFVQVQSADAAGNTVTSELISFTTTSTSSTVTAVPALYAPVYRRSGSRTTIIVTGIARESASVRLYVDGTLTSTHTITSTSTVTSFAIPFSTAKLANGKHSYYVRAVNADGVVSAKSKTVRFTVSGSSVSKRVGLSVVSKYVVQQGDSLWSIARRFLGEGSRYKELITSNKDSVPSIVQRASRILIGWVLRIPIF